MWPLAVKTKFTDWLDRNQVLLFLRLQYTPTTIWCKECHLSIEQQSQFAIMPLRKASPKTLMKWLQQIIKIVVVEAPERYWSCWMQCKSNNFFRSISVVSTAHKESTQSSMRPPILHLQEAPPEVIAAMVDEADWDFDILKLEKASNHRWVSV